MRKRKQNQNLQPIPKMVRLPKPSFTPKETPEPMSSAWRLVFYREHMTPNQRRRFIHKRNRLISKGIEDA